MTARQYAPWLWVLLTLFVARVLGQILVTSNLAPILPPLHEWQSGLLPYPLLLTFQILIIGLFTKVCFDFTRGSGFFTDAHKCLGVPLSTFGKIYLSAMPVRYAFYMMLVPEARWFHGTIPIVLHMVLASFLLLLSSYQKRLSFLKDANRI